MPDKSDKEKDEAAVVKAPVAQRVSAAELLRQAAALLDITTGPRAAKTYQRLAADVREIADRIE